MPKAGLGIFFESYWGENSVEIAYDRLGMFREKGLYILQKTYVLGL